MRRRKERRLVAAYLTPWDDGDLLPWAVELIAAGRMAATIKQGLRLVRYFATLPGGQDLARRGLLPDALQAGLLSWPAQQQPPLPASPSLANPPPRPTGRAPVPPHNADCQATEGSGGLESELDRALDGDF